ncbi:hypothetical protein EVAR_21772_1 [Eumeta japonica]|uniref:BED-type domain-containing protein n=1 Tax=Eumeta variegata TaxID=151549 RepID=A0A4C1ZNB5_EUMVA|nr:hypothetical protein EVAR_21772_1 [Eumeta japonica]
MSVRKNTSVIWHNFNKDTQTLKATCNKCKDVLSYKSSSANLKSHLRRKHPSTYLSVFGADDQSSSTQKQPDQDEDRSMQQVNRSIGQPTTSHGPSNLTVIRAESWKHHGTPMI